jgi:3-hydroxyisobutyrate dehydrogenase-like beta-hydroxyacid dehydrogenase
MEPAGSAGMSHVAWIGTGLLGSGFVESLRSKGHEVAVWNRTVDKARALERFGARVAASPAEAAGGAERVHLCLRDDEAVEGVLGALGPIAIPVIDHTTVSPTGARERQARLRAQGTPFLACPVFMAPANARSAQGIMLCAGEDALVQRWLPALEQMTGKVLRYGKDAGVPAAIKLVGNTMIISMTGALADALTVAKASGVEPADAMRLFETFNVGNTLTGRGARLVSGDYRASFELSMAHKDVRLMLEATEGRPLSVLPGLFARMSALLEAGHGHDDLAILAKDVVPPKALGR